ncbi:MAG: TerB family tellurite resistance protein [Sandaracinus sp.]
MKLAKLPKEERLQLMKFVCSFAWADLEIADQERRWVHKLVQRLGLDADEAKQVERWLELPPRAEEVDPAQVPHAHRSIFLNAAREIIAADGTISDEERENLALLEQLLT